MTEHKCDNCGDEIHGEVQDVPVLCGPCGEAMERAKEQLRFLPAGFQSVRLFIPRVKEQIRLTVELSPEDAEKLFWAANSGELDDVGVTGAEFIEGDAGETC